ncbi:acyltransferase [Microbacterium sp. NPDC089318]
MSSSGSASVAKEKSAALRLPYLDGMRGLAALAVAIYHAYKFTGWTGDAESIPILGSVLQFGFLGVPVFIVLSGYVLMLPVVRNDLRFPRGVKQYLRNRARRILPPYYAALGLSLLLVLCVPAMQQPSGTQWDSKVPITTGDVVAHLFLVHDFSADWIGKINGPLWSVAVEWHIYFLLPFVLLPLWRRIGGLSTTVLMLGVSFALAALDFGTFAHPWLVALFAVGMLAAQQTEQPKASPRMVVLLGASSGVAVAGIGVFSKGGVLAYFAIEVLVGICLGVFLALLGPLAAQGKRPVAAAALSTRPLMFLGLISYSVYLLHSPLLAWANIMLLSVDLPILTHYLLMTMVALPIAIAICIAFYWLVERHFLNSRQRQVVHAAASSTRTPV